MDEYIRGNQVKTVANDHTHEVIQQLFRSSSSLLLTLIRKVVTIGLIFQLMTI